MAAPRKIDWERIEPDWRAGVKGVMQLAAEYEQTTGVKVSHTAISKHFKNLGIPRDLSAKVQSKADAMVSAAMVSGKVSTETTATDAQIINENAAIVAQVQLSQRKDIGRARSLAMLLFDELEALTRNQELFERIEELCATDSGDKLREAFHKALSLPGRVDMMKKLSEVLNTLVEKESKVYGIKHDAGSSAEAYEEALRRGQLAGIIVTP